MRQFSGWSSMDSKASQSNRPKVAMREPEVTSEQPGQTGEGTWDRRGRDGGRGSGNRSKAQMVL